MIFKNLLTFLLPLACALPWDGPKATVITGLKSAELFKRNQYGIAPVAAWSPIPTRKPRELFEGYDLWRRQSASLSSFTSSNYSYDTCGFESGSIGSCTACFPKFLMANIDLDNSWTCNSGYTCAIATSQNVWACCMTPSACQIATTCIPQSQLISCASNSACQGNDYVTKWCVTFTLLEPISSTNSGTNEI